jgi:hypothetical protein
MMMQAYFEGLWSRIVHMFEVVGAEGHGNVLLVLFIGFVFGAIIQWSRVDKFEKIAGFAMLVDMTVPKLLFFGIGLASVGLFFMVEMGWAHYHIKPMMLGGVALGAVIFGIAMAIFGKCPGTGPISVAEGRIDVLVGAIGGIFGGAFFTWAYPWMKTIMGPDFGKMKLPDFFPGHEHWVVLVYGIVLMAIAVAIPDIEYRDPAEEEGDTAQ